VEKIKYFKDKRVRDPYIDRRSGEDRRQVYDTAYWESEGIESAETVVSKYPNGQAYA